jgi:hypothetical protein
MTQELRLSLQRLFSVHGLLRRIVSGMRSSVGYDVP